ncbi:MAG TPA: hypothetical protein VF573_09285 [Paraburkholderia sp.]
MTKPRALKGAGLCFIATFFSARRIDQPPAAQPLVREIKFAITRNQ